MSRRRPQLPSAKAPFRCPEPRRPPCCFDAYGKKGVTLNLRGRSKPPLVSEVLLSFSGDGFQQKC